MPPVPRARPTSPLVGLTGTALVAVSLVAVIGIGGSVLGYELPFGLGARGEVAGATSEPTARPTPRPSLGGLAVEGSPSPSPVPSASPSASPSPTPAPSPSPTRAPTGPYEVNLYGRNDFVSQATKDWCVAGAMQTMLNVMDVRADRSDAYQRRLATLARRLSDHPDGGTEPEGWAAGLTREGGGPYEVRAAPSRNAALRLAARAIRTTGRPVGLLVWRGAHSWVMHGFRATGDPAAGGDWELTHVYISDPWYPRISSIWGESRKPNAKVPVARMAEDFLPWRRPNGRYPGKDGDFVVVLPVAP